MLYAKYISIKTRRCDICVCVYMWFVYYPVISLGSIPKHGITKLKDKHIFKTSDSYCQIPHHKASDKAHLRHWQERWRAGVTNQRARSRVQGTPAAAQWLRHCTATAGGTDSNPGQGPPGAAWCSHREKKEKGSGSKENKPEGKGRPLEGKRLKPSRPFCKHQRRLRAQGEGVTRSSRPPPPTQNPELMPLGITGCPLHLTSGGGAGAPGPDTGPPPLMAFPFGSQKRKTGSDVNF